MDLGVRQDFKTEAAFAEYFNRFVHVEFMKSTYFDGDNKLRDHCLAQLTSLPIIAAMRCRAIIHDKFTRRLSCPFF